jgi:hypothetical protein
MSLGRALEASVESVSGGGKTSKRVRELSVRFAEGKEKYRSKKGRSLGFPAFSNFDALLGGALFLFDLLF